MDAYTAAVAAFVGLTNENFKVVQKAIDDYAKRFDEQEARIKSLEKEIKQLKGRV